MPSCLHFNYYENYCWTALGVFFCSMGALKVRVHQLPEAVDKNMHQSPLGPPPVSSCVLTITFSLGAVPLPSADTWTADFKTAR